MLILLFLFDLGYLVDQPTTYVPPPGSYELEFRIGANGKVIGRIGVSPFESFVFGISYGGEKILGSGTPIYNSSPGVQAKWGAASSKYSFAIGYDSEKYGNSPAGVYGVLGGDLGWKLIPYLGINYHDSLGAFCGMEAGLSPSASLSVEASLKKDSFIFNSGIRWIFEQRVVLEFDFKDIFSEQLIRAIKFSYIEYI